MAITFGQLDKNYVSSVDFLDQREILNQVLNITNEEKSFVDIMEMMGKSIVTAVPTYHHWINEEIYQTLTVNATGTDAALDGDNRQTVVLKNSTVNNVRAGEIVMLPDGTTAYVYSVDRANDSIELEPITTGTQAAYTYSDDMVLAVIGNAAGEGSFAPEGRNVGVSKASNQVQIFKESYKLTDVESANRIEFNFNGKPFYFLKGQHEALMKFRADIAQTMLFGRISDAGFAAGSTAKLLDANGKPIQTTRGLNQYIEENGIQENLSGAEIIDLGLFADLARTFAAKRTPKTYTVYTGVEPKIQIDNMANALTSGASFSPNARIMVDGKELDLGMDRLSIYGYNYNIKMLPIFDHQNYAESFKKRAFLVPEGTVGTIDGGQVERMRMRYMESNLGFDAKYREILLGGLAPTPTSSESVLEIVYESRQGLEVLGSEHFAQITLA